MASTNRILGEEQIYRAKAEQVLRWDSEGQRMVTVVEGSNIIGIVASKGREIVYRVYEEADGAKQDRKLMGEFETAQQGLIFVRKLEEAARRTSSQRRSKYVCLREQRSISTLRDPDASDS